MISHTTFQSGHTTLCLKSLPADKGLSCASSSQPLWPPSLPSADLGLLSFLALPGRSWNLFFPLPGMLLPRLCKNLPPSHPWHLDIEITCLLRWPHFVPTIVHYTCHCLDSFVLVYHLPSPIASREDKVLRSSPVNPNT